MRRGEIIGGLGGVMLLLLLLAPGAFAATPRQIYNDFADNGHLDHAYSNADLQHALHDATVQAYGSGSLKPTIEAKLAAKKKKAKTAPSGVSPGQATKTNTAPAPAPLTTVKKKGALPFTGAQLGLFAVIGVALIASGLLLRLTGRQKRRI